MSYMNYITPQEEPDLQKQHDARKAAAEMLLELMEDKGLINGNKAVAYKNNPTSLSPQTPYIHGAGGLLSDPGQSPAMLSTMVQPMPGMVSAIPRIDSGDIYPVDFDGGQYGGEDIPFITTITGITTGDGDSWANQPQNLCDDPPVGGLLKACTQTASFGRFQMKLRQMDRTRLGRLNNRGETTDFNILNNYDMDNPLRPEEAPRNLGGAWINQEFSARVFEAAMSFQRLVAPLVYSGTPANNAAGGGRRQFLGFNNIYKTGRVDVLTQVACAAMDSQLINFNANATGTNIYGRYLYQVLDELMWYLEDFAEFTGLNPVEFAISMDKNLFRTLCNIIPTQQYVQVITSMAAINTASKDGGQLHFDGKAVNDLRNDMYQRGYLPLNGKMIRVITEDPGTIGATYTASTNTFLSDIYVHPMTVLGGIPVTYWQFFNHANAQGRYYDEFLSKGLTWTTDGGKFLWASNFKNFCGDAMWLTEPRIMSHAPQLGARIQNVAYQPVMTARSAYPTQSSFFLDGGRNYGNTIYGTPSWSNSSVALGVPT